MGVSKFHAWLVEQFGSAASDAEPSLSLASRSSFSAASTSARLSAPIRVTSRWPSAFLFAAAAQLVLATAQAAVLLTRASGDRRLDRGAIGDVAGDNLATVDVHVLEERRRLRRRSHHHSDIVSVAPQRPDGVAPEKAGRSGDEDLHGPTSTSV